MKRRIIIFGSLILGIIVLTMVLKLTNLANLKGDISNIEIQDNEAMFKSGIEVNRKMKSLAGNEDIYSSKDTNIKKIVRSDTLSITPMDDNIVSISSGKPIYMWFSGDTLYYYSEVNKIYLNPTSRQMFNGLSGVTSIDLNGIDTSKATDMAYMFSECKELKSLDLSNWDTGNVTYMFRMFWDDYELSTITFGSNFNTSNVTSMDDMFNGCNKLTSIDLSSFDTSNVTTMENMFMDCESLTSLDLSSFNNNTSLTNISRMFYNCTSLNNLNLDGFDTSNVTNMRGLFTNCKSLTSINLSSFITSKVEDMSEMFFGCEKLGSIIFGTFDTGKVTRMNSMFANCSSLNSLNISNFNTNKVENMSYMFSGCSSLTSLDISQLKTDNVTNMSGMFSGCSSLTNIDLSHLSTSNVTTFSKMFESCSSLTSLDLSSLDTSSLQDMSNIFEECSSLTSVNLNNIDTSNVTNMSSMFEKCSSLTTLDLSSLNTSNVTLMSYMFDNCISLTNLNLSSFDTSKVTTMSYMFMNCKELTSLNLNNFITSNVTNMRSMFQNCESINNLDLKNFDTTQVTSMESMFENCKELRILDISTFNTSNNKSLMNMFKNCEKITSLNLSNFKTSNVTNMYGLFEGCKNLVNLNISNFDTSKVTEMSYMFKNCEKITSLDLSHFNTSNVTRFEGMFENCLALTSLNISSFDTSKATSLFSMFMDCDSLEVLDIQSFDTNNVTNMSQTFRSCDNLVTIYASERFVTNQVTNDYGIFYDNYKLKGQNGTVYSDDMMNDKLYARIDRQSSPGLFSELTYTITYNGNGAINGSTANSIHSCGTPKQLTKNGYTKIGYVFIGWNTKEDGTGEAYLDEEEINIITLPTGGTLTLYAQWIQDTFTLTFDANGGNVSESTKDVIYGNTYSNLPIPTKDGYNFLGWYYDLTQDNDYINYARDYMYTDSLSIHFSAYMNNWENYTSMISSDHQGGLNIDSSNGKISFSCYDSGVGYKNAESEVEWSSLTSGWHEFDMIFDGEYFSGYLDGQKIATSERFESGKIGYNINNSLFIGAKAGDSPLVPTAASFSGYVGNVIIKDDSNIIPSDSYNTFTVPAQNVTLYARWEEAGNNKVAIPTSGLCVSRTYNGSSQQLVENTTFEGYTLSDVSGVIAKSYTITATLNDGYVWYDNSTGNKTFECMILPKNIETASVTILNQTYTGNPLTPAPTVKVDNQILSINVDYTVTYENNTNVGTATVNIAGKDNYTGSAIGHFDISETASQDISIVDTEDVVKENNTFIINVPNEIKLEKSKLLEMINIPGEFIIKDKNNNEIIATNQGVGTNAKIIHNGIEYLICLKGDINGDGEITIVDLINTFGYMNSIDKGTTVKLDQNQIKAADYVVDGIVNIVDLINIFGVMKAND